MTINYDPKNVVLTYNGVIIDGFAPDTYIEIEYAERRYNTAVGVTGKGIRSKRNNRMAVVRVSLLPGSPSNLVFQAAYAADEAANAGSFPLTLNSFGTGENYASAGAWVAAEPNASFQAEAQPRVWELETDELVPTIGAAP